MHASVNQRSALLGQRGKMAQFGQGPALMAPNVAAHPAAAGFRRMQDQSGQARIGGIVAAAIQATCVFQSSSVVAPNGPQHIFHGLLQ